MIASPPGTVVSPLGPIFGVLVENRAGSSATIACDDQLALLSEYGVVLYRGFVSDVDEFRRFSDDIGDYTALVTPWRQSAHDSDETVRTVESHVDAIGPHAELCWAPFQPALGWFYCQTPPDLGGETLFYDGRYVVESLEPAMRDDLAARAVEFITKSPPRFDWHSWLGGSVEEATETLQAISETPHSYHQFSFRDETLYLKFVRSVFTPSAISGELAFNATILEKGAGKFEGGDEISDSYRASLSKIARASELVINWRAGDTLVFDNTRVLHGRRALQGVGERRILARFGNLAGQSAMDDDAPSSSHSSSSHPAPQRDQASTQPDPQRRPGARS